MWFSNYRLEKIEIRVDSIEAKLEKLEHQCRDIIKTLRGLFRLVESLEDQLRKVRSFYITGEIMGSTPSGLVSPQKINPGQSVSLTAQPLDANGNPTTLPTTDVPVWTTSDPANSSLSPSANGLSCVVSIPASAPVESVTITVTDAVIPAATGSFVLEIQAVTPPTPNPVASFAITSNTPA